MEFNYAITWVAALALSFLLYYYLHRSRFANKHKSPPEAGGAWPFIGHLHRMSGGPSKLPHINLASLADKYGPAFTIRLGVRRVLVISSSELAKELFTTCDAAISSRPKVVAGKYLGYNDAMFGFSPYGPYWRELRKLVSLELLSNRRVELLRHVLVSEVSQSVNDLYKLCAVEKRAIVVEMKQWFSDLSLNVMTRMVVGKRLSDRGAGRWKEVIRELFHLAGQFLVADAMPYLGWLDVGGYKKRMKRAGEEFDRIVGGWLEEHREKEDTGSKSQQDFMDVMLSVVGSVERLGQYDADTIIKATCGTLIGGGTDTNTVMLVWTLSLLLNNRDVLRKAQDELDRHVGRERRVKESDISNLVYLQAIVKETLRLYPAGPFLNRIFSEDAKVGGLHVPKGTWLIVNLWKLLRDPNVWADDPSEFKPERFLSTHKHVDVKGSNFELIPFGAGRRICPGVNLGLQMLHLVLANLLHAFDLSTVSDELVDMSEIPGVSNMKATPLDVVVAPRLDPSLYEAIEVKQ